MSYRVHEVKVQGRHYLVLPKLNPDQLGFILLGLQKEGFRVKGGNNLVARRAEGTIRVEPSGLCVSSFGASDVVLPLIPGILACNRHERTTEEICEMYFHISPGRASTLEVIPRIESHSTWDFLRAGGLCGLAPDEHSLVSFLLEEAVGMCSLVTDFPCEDSTPLVRAGRRYYESSMSVNEVLPALRLIGESRRRSAYLPRDGVLGLSGVVHSRRSVGSFVEGLGEWCSFKAA